MTHAHTWSVTNATLRRYACCGCGAIGHSPFGRRGIIPYACQHENAERKHCGRPATFVNGMRTQNRCDEHRANNQPTKESRDENAI